MKKIKEIKKYIFPKICVICQLYNIQAQSDKNICHACQNNFMPNTLPRLISNGHGKNLQIFAPYFYQGALRDLLLKFKHRDASYLAKTFSEFMCRSLHNAHFDVIVPIPLHTKRLLQRGYNQSALLAYYLGKFLSKPVHYSLLKRTRHTPMQRGLSDNERKQNVQDAFQCTTKCFHLKRPSVLLVDDVCTSGATLLSAQKALHDYEYLNIMACVIATTAHNQPKD